MVFVLVEWCNVHVVLVSRSSVVVLEKGTSVECEWEGSEIGVEGLMDQSTVGVVVV